MEQSENPKDTSISYKLDGVELPKDLVLKLALSDKGQIFLLKEKNGTVHYFSKNPIDDISKVDMSTVVMLDIPFTEENLQ